MDELDGDMLRIGSASASAESKQSAAALETGRHLLTCPSQAIRFGCEEGLKPAVATE
jgi:hypothetical protein